MAAIAMLVLALIAAVAVFFVLRTENGDEDAEYDELVTQEREPVRR